MKMLLKEGQRKRVLVVKLERIIIILLMGFIFYGESFGSINEYQNLYHKVKKLYDMSEYAKCIDESSRIIRTREKSFLETDNYISLANLYELRADCLERKGEIVQAVEEIQILLKRMEQILPQDYVARVRLKVGHIYKRAGLYSKALASFKKVEEKYKHIFPNRFAKYARENYDEVTTQQVAVISGEVVMEDNDTYEGVTVKVFNGFELSETEILKKGKYSISLFSSTPHTGFALYVCKEGYKPHIVTGVFDGSAKIVMKKIQLKKLLEKDRGVVAGVVFVPVSGGKRKPHHGIGGFKKHKIKFAKLSRKPNGKEATKDEVIFVSSNDDGIYTTSLATGIYLLKNEEKEKMFELRRGEVRILNIMQGGILVD